MAKSSISKPEFIVLLALLMLSPAICRAGDWFPITAWGMKDDHMADTSWVREVRTSFHANSTAIGWKNEKIMDAILRKGASCGVSFIVTRLRESDSDEFDLTTLARAQFSVYQSDNRDPEYISMWPSSNGYFDSYHFTRIGTRVRDTRAPDDTAWACWSDRDEPGYMQRGMIQHLYGHRQKYADSPYDTASLAYEARFYLRIPSKSNRGNLPVCRLEVWRNSIGDDGNDTTYYLLDSTTIYRKSFSDSRSYQPFSLWFSKDKSMLTRGNIDTYNMDYRIYWNGNYDLIVDRVEVRDTIFYNLEKGTYNKEIQATITRWNHYPAMKYYYAWDEPYLNQFESFKLLEQIMSSNAKPLICIVNHRYKRQDIYYNYREFIHTAYGENTTPLLVDKYELRPADTIPDSIQSRFTMLCDWMDNVRAVAETTGTSSRDVWYVCQAHKFIQSGRTALRNPTPEELWALVGLGLAHGAKGIMYYRYKSLYWREDTIIGLMEYEDGRWRPNGKWHAARDINLVLQEIDETLLDCDLQTAFNGNNPRDYLEYSSLGALSEFGLFEDSKHQQYFLMVNRRDNYDFTYPSEDSTLVSIGMNRDLHGGKFYIEDCYSGDGFFPDLENNARDRKHFSFYLKNCHFKLFKIIQSNQ